MWLGVLESAPNLTVTPNELPVLDLHGTTVLPQSLIIRLGLRVPSLENIGLSFCIMENLEDFIHCHLVVQTGKLLVDCSAG